jgi:predicted dithiol-disulfide oxidoreductase (DUF899 family)
MPDHKIVSRDEWIAARREHLAKEKELTRRGLDVLNGAYQLLDLVPNGRDEDGLPSSMEWLRHDDRYDGQPVRMLGGLRPPPAREGARRP